jgi:3-oxoacyl-[acyl-carrier-protein] synthase-1
MLSTLEILDFRYTLSWELDTILTDVEFNNNLNQNFPLIVSTETGLDFRLQEKVWSEFLNNRKKGRPSEIRMSSPDGVASYVAKCLDLKSQCFMLNATCSSGSYALYVASLLSLDTNSPVVIFCGDNLTNNFDFWKFKSFGALDQQTGIPFDKFSKGFRMGTGAITLIVKHPMVQFNLDPKAIIKKFYFYTDPGLVANPGSVKDLVQAFSQVNFKSANFWNAHATGTAVGDFTEYNFFKNVSNESTPIVSFKGYIGHCINASNPIEICMAIEGKQKNILLANKIIGEKIVEDDRIIDSDQSWPGNNMIKASFGFGGRSSILEIEIA